MSQQLKAIYEDGVFRPLEAVCLKEYQEVTLVLEIDEANDVNKLIPPIWEFAAELARDIPDDEWNRVPVDGATELEHYLYGAHKNQVVLQFIG